MIKECFKQEIQRLSDFCDERKFDLAFMLAADSHLDDYEEDTILNMQAADSFVSYDFLVHLGDFMTGNMPKGYTAKVLRQEMNQYRSAVKNGVFYPVQGNHDGYCVSSFMGRSCDIVVDEDWYEATDFTREYQNVTREEKVRIIMQIILSRSFGWYSYVLLVMNGQMRENTAKSTECLKSSCNGSRQRYWRWMQSGQ